jgi:DNA polymerase-3 subunit chi
MADVWFYHLEREPVGAVLPRILTGLYQRRERVCVMGADKTELAALAKLLWQHDETGFVPQGLAWESADDQDHVCFAVDTYVPNGADHLIYVGLMPAAVDGIRRASVFFDGSNDTEVAAARAAWKVFRDAGHGLKYWRQSDAGRWEDQAAREAA